MQESLSIHRSPSQIPQNSFLVDSFKFVLKNNYFDFDGRHFQQIARDCNGHQVGTILCQLTDVLCEDKYVYTHPLQTLLWKRVLEIARECLDHTGNESHTGYMHKYK